MRESEANTFSLPSKPTRRQVITRMTGAAGLAAAAGLGLPVFAQARTIRIGATFDNSSVEKANGTGLFLGLVGVLQRAQPRRRHQWHARSSW